MLSTNQTSVRYAECRKLALSAECHYAECRGAHPVVLNYEMSMTIKVLMSMV
jgi:hypothetical protein